MSAEALNITIGLGGILIGVVVTYIFHRAGLRSREPTYTLRSTNLIRDFTSRLEALEIRYAGDRIPNLTATKVAFWNNGKATIDGTDIADADPLAIRLRDGYKILDASLSCQSNAASQLSLKLSDDAESVLVQFDYLDQGDGGVIQILHTGKGSDDVEVRGTVKGAKKLQRRLVPHLGRLPWPVRSVHTHGRRRLVFAVVMFLMPFLAVALVALCALLQDLSRRLVLISWGVVLLNAVLLVSLFVSYWGLAIFGLKTRLPKGLDAFEEDI